MQMAAPSALCRPLAQPTHACVDALSNLPATQLVHLVRGPSWFVTFPSPHAAQPVLPAPEANVSSRQEVQVPPVPARPASHGVHPDWPTLAIDPSSQVSQVAAPSALCKPPGQRSHACVDAFSNRPAAHFAQVVRRPSWFVTFPSPHAAQPVLPAPEANVSSRQELQPPPMPARPASHGVHPV